MPNAPNLGTVVPRMGTTDDLLAEVLFGRTRRAVLGLLFEQPDAAFYVREVARHVRAGQGAVHRELQRLARAGVVQRTQRGRQVFFQAERGCPVFAELRALVAKTTGALSVVRGVLAPLAGRVRAAFVYGSFARGEQRPGSDIDLCIVGDVTFGAVVRQLAPAQEQLGREINPTVYSAAEFGRKAAAREHFVSALLSGPRRFLIGDDDELGRMAAKRLAGGASDEPR